jgi:heterodisulfide reductase subunit C
MKYQLSKPKLCTCVYSRSCVISCPVKQSRYKVNSLKIFIRFLLKNGTFIGTQSFHRGVVQLVAKKTEKENFPNVNLVLSI